MKRPFFRNLQSAWWEFIHPEFDEPDFDEVSHTARRQWFAGRKHPAECAGGCQCGLGGEGDVVGLAAQAEEAEEVTG